MFYRRNMVCTKSYSELALHYTRLLLLLSWSSCLQLQLQYSYICTIKRQICLISCMQIIVTHCVYINVVDGNVYYIRWIKYADILQLRCLIRAFIFLFFSPPPYNLHENKFSVSVYIRVKVSFWKENIWIKLAREVIAWRW